MPGKILGLEINEKNLTAVQVVSGLKGYNLISCARINAEGKDLEKALRELSKQVDLKSDNTFISISGSNVSFRNITVPFKDKRKIRQTIPFELETIAPFPVDEMIVDFHIINNSDKTEVLAAAIKKDRLRDYLSTLAAAGIDPDIVDINPIPVVSWILNQDNCPDKGVYIDMGIERNCMILFLSGHIVLVREFYSEASGLMDSKNKESDGVMFSNDYDKKIESLCKEVMKTLHSFGLQNNTSIMPDRVLYGGIGALYTGAENILKRFFETPVERINVNGDKRLRVDYNVARIYQQTLMDNALAIALRDTRKNTGFNLRQGEFEIKKRYLGPKQEIKKAAVLLGLFLIFLIFDLGIGYYSLKGEYGSLKNTVTEQRIRLFPETKNIPDNELAIRDIEARQKGLSSSGTKLAIKQDQTALDVLKDITTRLQASSYDMDVTNMVFDQDSVRISGTTDSYTTPDSMKNDLEPSPYFTSVALRPAAADRSGRIKFEIVLTRAD